MRENLAVQVTTGNVRTSVDAYDATKPNNGAKNALGAVYYDPVTGCKYRYVQCAFTATPTIQASPACVWWTDAAKTKITATLSECYDTKSSSVAGLMMANSTDVSGLTTAILKNGAATTGYFVWICVAGVVTAVTSAAAAAGDAMIATQTDWTTTGGFSKTTDGTAPTNRVVAYAKAASADAVNVVVESL